MAERQSAVLVVYGYDRLVEAAFLEGDLGTLLGDEAYGVDVFALCAFEGCDQIRADSLVPLRVRVAKRHVAGIEQATALLGGGGGE